MAIAVVFLIFIYLLDEMNGKIEKLKEGKVDKPDSSQVDLASMEDYIKHPQKYC